MLVKEIFEKHKFVLFEWGGKNYQETCFNKSEHKNIKKIYSYVL